MLNSCNKVIIELDYILKASDTTCGTKFKVKIRRKSSCSQGKNYRHRFQFDNMTQYEFNKVRISYLNNLGFPLKSRK